MLQVLPRLGELPLVLRNQIPRSHVLHQFIELVFVMAAVSLEACGFLGSSYWILMWAQAFQKVASC